MSRPITIAEMERKVRWQADMLRAELRNTSVEVRESINQSIQTFRDQFSWNGDSYFLSSYVGIIPGGPTIIDGMPMPWGSIDISGVSPGVVRIIGIDVQVNGQVNVELDHISFAERNYTQGVWLTAGVPTQFFSYDQNTIGVCPVPMAPYNFVLWYLPVLPELMADDDEFDPGVPGADQWVVFDVCEKLLARDNDPKRVAIFMRQKENIWQSILKAASKRQRVGPTYRLDTRGRKRRKKWLAYFGWWT
jgi:hypothetical protein